MTSLAVSMGMAKFRFCPPPRVLMPTTLPGQIHQRPAAVAGIDRRVHLDPVGEVAGLKFVNVHVLGIKRPLVVGDDAKRHGAGQPKGRADRHHVLAGNERSALAEFGMFECHFLGFTSSMSICTMARSVQ